MMDPYSRMFVMWVSYGCHFFLVHASSTSPACCSIVKSRVLSGTSTYSTPFTTSRPAKASSFASRHPEATYATYATYKSRRFDKMATRFNTTMVD